MVVALKINVNNWVSALSSLQSHRPQSGTRRSTLLEAVRSSRPQSVTTPFGGYKGISSRSYSSVRDRRGCSSVSCSAPLAEIAAIAGAQANMAGSLVLAFEPWPALIAGLAMGVAASGKLLLTGRVLGISGAFKGYLHGDLSWWRTAFVGGMVLGALCLPSLLPPTAFDVLPATYTISRAVFGALLVGLGSAIGNGCTSGHGISGISRLSVRSMAYTLTFMLAGIFAATLTGTCAALGVANVAATYTPPVMAALQPHLKLLAATIVALVTAGLLGSRAKAGSTMETAMSLLTELTAGIVFALGLGMSGMVKLTKVAGFLSMLAPSRDFSLMFVMGGALLVATPLTQMALARFRKGHPPLCASECQLPAATQVDTKLMTGGFLFGTGWGICGGCPGPILVNAVVSPSSVNLALLAALMVGMALAEHVVTPLLFKPKGLKQKPV